MYSSANLTRYCHLVSLLSDPETYTTACNEQPELVDSLTNLSRIFIVLTAIHKVSLVTTASTTNIVSHLNENLSQDSLEIDKTLLVESYLQDCVNYGLVTTKYLSEYDIELVLTNLGKFFFKYKRISNHFSQTYN